MSKKKNPIIEKARQEGYNQGRGQAVAYFLDWIEHLEEIEGIGPKTVEKLAKHFLSYGKGDPSESNGDHQSNRNT